MKRIPFLLILTFFAGATPAWAQSRPGTAPAQTSPRPDTAPVHLPDTTLTQALHFADSALNRPNFTYDISEPDIPKDIQSILIRFNDAIAANKQWFIDYRNQYAAGGQPLPYNQRFGITREEYRRVQQLEKVPPRMVTLSQQKVTISRESNTIHLKGEGETRILDYLEINLKDQKVIFGGDTLGFTGTMGAAQLTPFSLAKGYTWRLETADLRNILQTNAVTARVIEIDLALPIDADHPSGATQPGGATQPNSTGKSGSPADPGTHTSIQPADRVFLRIKYQDVQAGQTRADMDLVGFIH